MSIILMPELWPSLFLVRWTKPYSHNLRRLLEHSIGEIHDLCLLQDLARKRFELLVGGIFVDVIIPLFHTAEFHDVCVSDPILQFHN